MNSLIKVFTGVALTLTPIFTVSHSLHAQDDVCSVAVPRQVLCDDFSDGDPFDGSPVTWETGRFTDRVFISDGDLHVTTTDPADDHAVGRVQNLWLQDVSIRTQGHIQVEGNSPAALAIYGRHEFLFRPDQTLSTFWGVVTADGTVQIGGHGWGNQWVYAQTPTDLDPRLEEVVMQLDIIGSKIAFRAWRPDEDMPAEPMVSHTIDENPSGGVALFMGSPAPMSDAIYRCIQVATSPIPAVSGDFNRNGSFDVDDIGSLSAKVLHDEFDSSYDLNLDGVLDQVDRSIWVHDHAITYFGDANLNGEFNSADFVQVFQAGTYETKEEAGWSEGDWNGDGIFDSSDFVIAFQDGGYEKGPTADTVAVPEPRAMVLLLIAMFQLGIRRIARTR